MTTTNLAAPIDFESEILQAAHTLRSNMDAAEFKHIVLGLVFLNCIFDRTPLSS
jgi:type I restriction enzyme M protein